MNTKIIILIASIFFFYNNTLTAQHEVHSEAESCCAKTECHSNAPDGVAPVGIMADHTHHKKGLMFSYRLMNMQMDGNLSGTSDISNAAIFSKYMLAPENMSMQMHMIGAMYGLTNKITLTAMMGYQRNEMSMLMMNGNEHQHESDGIGDLKLGAIVGLWKNKNHSINANAGLNIPTGNIGVTEMNHLAHQGHEAGMETVMPYPMRLGSGTYDVVLGATYLGKWNRFSLGFQTANILRTGENSRDYRLGNNYRLNTWGAYRVNNWCSFSLRAEGLQVAKMEGEDTELMKMMSPTNNPVNFGKAMLYGYGGMNIYFAKFWHGMHLGAEFGLPFYQDVEGIQMKENNVFTVGLRFDVL